MARIVLFGTLAACVLGTALSTRADDAEDKAAEFFRHRSCDVVRDESQPGKPVTKVILRPGRFTSDELKQLGSFKKLTILIVQGKGLATDDSLKSIATVSSLETLELAAGAVT